MMPGNQARRFESWGNHAAPENIELTALPASGPMQAPNSSLLEV